MLFAVGAGDQVVAADSYSNYPSDAPTTDLSAYEPNVEAIAKYEPDLVVYASDPGDLQSSLDKLKIPALEEPAAATLDDVYAQLRELGVVTGHADAGDQQATQLQDRIDEIQTAAADAGKGMTYYYELDDTYYSVTSDTFIGNLLATLGLKNIADEAKGASSGYPQLSAEYIVSADPDLILLADTKCCNQSPEKVAKRAGWGDLTAVQHDGVVPLDDDIASRWGPRIADLLQQVGDAVQQQAAA
jgi:iron complex transport system substrate-binding protein